MIVASGVGLAQPLAREPWTQLVADYPLRVMVTVVKPGLETSKVHVLLDGGATPVLESFLGQVLPATLRATGALPAPAAVPTEINAGFVPDTKLWIPGNGELPVTMRVRATQGYSNKACDEGGEWYKGVVDDTMSPWKWRSYFISTFTATAKIRKEHVNVKFQYPVTALATGTRKTFNWRDP